MPRHHLMRWAASVPWAEIAMERHLVRLLLLLFLGGCPFALPTGDGAGGQGDRDPSDYRCQEPDPPEPCKKMGDERD